jgi:glutathione S-transferase
MKLYYSPGACSLATHIVLHETGLKFDAIKVNLRTKQIESAHDGAGAANADVGKDYTKINPKGSVPAIVLDDGQLLTEGAVLLQYIADQKPQTGLMPKFGSMERYQCMEWLNYIATEVHKGCAPLFNPASTDEMKTTARTQLAKKFDFISEKMQKNNFLMGSQFTSPDAYLFTILSWTPRLGIDMSKWPTLSAFYERTKARPAVNLAMKHEGLL